MIFCPPLGTSIIPSQRYFDDDVPIPVWWDMWWFPGGYWCSMNLLEVLKVLAVSLRDLGGMSLSSNKLITLPQTNSSHLKIGHRKRKLVLQPSICRGYVSFRECRRVFSVRFGGRGFLKQWIIGWLGRPACEPKFTYRKTEFRKDFANGCFHKWGYPKMDGL